MFHWICPECGREIPPAVKECPACDPHAVSAATVPEPVAVAPPPAIAAPPPIPRPAVEPEPPLDILLALAESIRAAQQARPADSKPEIRLASEPKSQPPKPDTRITPEPAASPKTESPKPAIQAPPELASVAAPKAELLQPDISATAPETEPRGMEMPPAPEQAAVAAPKTEPPKPAIPVTPEPISVATPKSEPHLEPLLLAEPPRALALLPAPRPEPASPEAVKTKELPQIASPLPNSAIPEQQHASDPAPKHAVAVSVESIKPEPTAPPAHKSGPPLAMDLAASTAELPISDRPPSGSWLQLAGLQDYRAAAHRAMQPAAPEAKIFTPDSGPRITLPGPTLPPQLNSLQAANVTVLRTPEPRATSALPGWVVSLLFVIGIPAVGAALLFYFMPLGRSNAETKPAPQEPQATVVQAASHPLAQYVEVTGFRFIVDLNKKSEIHYLVVNHSAAELADMTVYVTLHAADEKAGQPPVCRFTFRAPTLAAFESKEMTSPIEKLTHPVALPDWQDLRAEVQITQ